MGETTIQWTDATWNPTRGCSRISPGCENCYAEKIAARFSGKGMPYEGLAEFHDGEARWTRKLRLVINGDDRDGGLGAPLRWKKPRRIFVNSMSDLFHEALSDEEIAAVFGVMAACPQHTFQVLTKRAERMQRWFLEIARYDYIDPMSICEIEAANRVTVHQLARPWPLSNVHLGVSVETQKYADERIPHLLATPAAVRFVSYEPALGPVDFTRMPHDGGEYDVLAGTLWRGGWRTGAGLRANKLDWIIVGGESGPNARGFDLSWARSTIEQCKRAHIACFVKQLGGKPYEGESAEPTGRFRTHDGKRQVELKVQRLRLRDRKGGDIAEWPEELRVRQFPKEVAA